MIDLYHWLAVAAAHLDQAEARYAVVGGLAVAVRAQPRFTQDVDLAVAVTDDSAAERIAGYLIRSGFSPLAEFDRKAQGRLATMRFVPPGAASSADTDPPILVDLLFHTSGIEPEIVSDATPYRFTPELRLPVARLPHLIAMKVLSASERREKDLVDLRSLLAVARPPELATVRRLLRLIVRRGCHQDRDLLAELVRHLRERGPDSPR